MFSSTFRFSSSSALHSNFFLRSFSSLHFFVCTLHHFAFTSSIICSSFHLWPIPLHFVFPFRHSVVTRQVSFSLFSHLFALLSVGFCCWELFPRITSLDFGRKEFWFNFFDEFWFLNLLKVEIVFNLGYGVDTTTEKNAQVMVLMCKVYFVGQFYA